MHDFHTKVLPKKSRGVLSDWVGDGLFVSFGRIDDESVLLGHVRDPLVVNHDVQFVEIRARYAWINLKESHRLVFI